MDTNETRERLAQIETRLAETADMAQTMILRALSELDTMTDSTRQSIHGDIQASRAQIEQLARQGAKLATELGDTETAERMARVVDTMPRIPNIEGMDTPDPLDQVAGILNEADTEATSLRAAILREALPLINEQLLQAIPTPAADEPRKYHLLSIEFGEGKPTTEKEIGRGVMVAATINHLREGDPDDIYLLLSHEEAAKQLGEQVAPDIIALLTFGTATQLDPPEGEEPEKRRARTLMVIHPFGMDCFTHLEGDPEPMHVKLDSEADADKLAAGGFGELPKVFAAFYLRAYAASGKVPPTND
jgi:hypothetical protein